MQTTALACSLPRTHRVPLARWSPADIARRLISLRSVTHISVSTVRRWLVAAQLRPWRYRMWQHIHDPELFLERARPVLWLYQAAQHLLRHGTWVVCVDEKTSIQAREAAQAPEPTRPSWRCGNRRATTGEEPSTCSRP